AEKTKLAGQVSLGFLLSLGLIVWPQLDGMHTKTSLPFVPNGTIEYDFLTPLVGFEVGWVVYIPVLTFILAGVSNAVNLTDGLGLAVMVYITGNIEAADFVNDLYIRETGELTIFVAALVAACFGFLWYNGYPAQVFMGDTGSLALGAAIATVAILVKKELYLPVLGGIFFVETASVIVQTAYFTYTKRRTGEGRRVFRMAPLHHHYEALGVHESKIVIRFWIVTALLVILTLFLLRIRSRAVR